MRLLYNSLNIHYFLTARLLAFLLLVSSVASACSSDKSAEEENKTAVNQENRSADTTSVKPPSVVTAATIDFIGNPFISNRSQSNSLSIYFNKIQDDFTLDAEAVSNMHRSTVTDTIYTIKFGRSLLELYAPTQTGELLLQVADIRDSSITMRHNIRVGISQVDLLGKLRAQDLLVRQTPNEVVAGNKEGAPILLHFYLKNGKVNRILYEGYVD
jgi:hypothetical protein